MLDPLRALAFSRRWLRFTLRGLFLVITLFGIWLGIQVNWLRQRQEARRWIEQHESPGQWSTKNPTDVTMIELDGTTHPMKAAEAPWSLRLLGESRLAFIRLDKSKLTEADIPRLNALHALFPEAPGVDINEPGIVYRWPPTDPKSYLKYRSRIVDGKVVNQPN
jgi:hypothetical protein